MNHVVEPVQARDEKLASMETVWNERPSQDNKIIGNYGGDSISGLARIDVICGRTGITTLAHVTRNIKT